jgi:hypothetical protein
VSHAADAPLIPPREFARTVPDVERLRALADRAVATHEAIRLRTLRAPCAPA